MSHSTTSFCIDCGKPTSASQVKRCWECHRANRILKAKEQNPGFVEAPRCADCGKPIDHGAIRCWDCYKTHEFLKAKEKNPTHQNKSEARCIDCGRRIDPQATRCLECYNAHRLKLAQEKNPNYRAYSYCVDCGAELPNKTAARCAACYAKNRTGSNNPNWRGGQSVCKCCGGPVNEAAKNGICRKCLTKGPPKCQNCGKPLSRYKGNTSGFCRKCYKGERTARWNPALTPDERNNGRAINPQYHAWRNAVYSRDGYQCQKCGDSPGGNLVAHHILSWRDNPGVRFDVNNGMTLCEHCHRQFHRIYGASKNNRNQLEEFLGGREPH